MLTNWSGLVSPCPIVAKLHVIPMEPVHRRNSHHLDFLAELPFVTCPFFIRSIPSNGLADRKRSSIHGKKQERHLKGSSGKTYD